MKRCLQTVTLGLAIAIASQVASYGQVLTMTGSGTWNSIAPSSTWTAPNGTWQFSVQISVSPMSGGTGCRSGSFTGAQHLILIFAISPIRLTVLKYRQHLSLLNLSRVALVMPEDSYWTTLKAKVTGSY